MVPGEVVWSHQYHVTMLPGHHGLQRRQLLLVMVLRVDVQVGPLSWSHTDDLETGVAEGTLECPDEVMDQWMVYRFGCTKSTAEKEAVMDICLAMLEDAAPIDTSITAGI